MPGACASGFILFEQLQCLGCHPMQPLVVETFTDERSREYNSANGNRGVEGIVRLCRNFVELLYLDSQQEAIELTEEQQAAEC